MKMRADPQNYEQLFSTEVQKYKDGIMKLANDQRGIIDNHLKSSLKFSKHLSCLGRECFMMKDVEPFIKWTAVIHLWVTQDGMGS